MEVLWNSLRMQGHTPLHTSTSDGSNAAAAEPFSQRVCGLCLWSRGIDVYAQRNSNSWTTFCNTVDGDRCVLSAGPPGVHD